MGQGRCLLGAPTLMAANLPLLALAIALLWIPRTWLRRGPTLMRVRSRGRTASPWSGSQDAESLSYRRELPKPRNYFDLFRAASATWAIMGGYGLEPALQAAPDAPSAVTLRVFAIQAAIVAIGLLLQTARFDRGRLSLTAPVFYIGGLTLILFGPLSGLCGFAIAWLLSPIFPNTQAFFFVQACVGLTISVLVHGVQLSALLAFSLCILPVVLCWLSRRPLLVPTRRGMASTRDVTP